MTASSPNAGVAEGLDYLVAVRCALGGALGTPRAMAAGTDS